MISNISCTKCAPFQTFHNSRNFSSIALSCAEYRQDSCCDSGVARRAVSWALEDDGCGVVGGECLRYLVDIGCMTNCKAGLQTGLLPTQWGMAERPLVCDDWALKVYNSCFKYAFCGTNQIETSTCRFVQQRKKTSTGSNVEVVSAYDACTLVSNYDVAEFAEQILQVVLGGNSTDIGGNCTSNVTRIQFQGAAYKNSVNGLTLLPLLIAGLALLFST